MLGRLPENRHRMPVAIGGGSSRRSAGLDDEWEEVGCHDFHALAVQRADGEKFRILRRRPR
jgi:hypothetical protein